MRFEQQIGVACIDANERLISVTEFDDDDFFSELEALLVLLGPKECVLPSSESDDVCISHINKHLLEIEI